MAASSIVSLRLRVRAPSGSDSRKWCTEQSVFVVMAGANRAVIGENRFPCFDGVHIR